MTIEDGVTLGNISLFSGEWLRVSQLAKKLNVHPDTIRLWEKKGRIKCARHPINNYRLFSMSNLWIGKKHHGT